MKDNRTDETCDQCNSHIIAYKENNMIVFECSYCGNVPEDIYIFSIEEFE